MQLRPIFEKNAAQTETDRRVVEENITALTRRRRVPHHGAEALRRLETDIRTKLEVSREVAMGCGSTAWVTALMNVCAFFRRSATNRRRTTCGAADPDARISGVFNPTATDHARSTVAYVVNGAWNWTSGCLHSDWSFLGVPIVDEAGEFVQPAMALMP